MIDTEGVAKALLQYRNTPLLGIGYSPAQMLFGRRQKTELPVLPQAYDPINTQEAERRRQATRDRAKDHHDKTICLNSRQKTQPLM